MKTLLLFLSGAILFAGAAWNLRADDPDKKGGDKPVRAESLDPSKKLTPEQKDAKAKELREKRREEFKNLTPEQKEAKMKEWRAKMETVVADLEKKKAAGSLTVEEQKKLASMEATLKKLDEKQREKRKASTPAEKPVEKPKPSPL